MYFLWFAILAILPLQAGDAGLKLPPEVKPEAGRRLVTITAETAGEIVKWKLPKAGTDGYAPILKEDVVPLDNGKTIKFPIPERPGRYVIEAHTAIGKQSFLEETVLVVQASGPPPNPKLPDIPNPPADTFAADIRRLYLADADPTKATHAKAIAGLYRQGAKLASDQSLKFVGDLQDQIGEAAKILLTGGDHLVDVRARVRSEVVAALVDIEAPLTDDLRKKAADIYGRAAMALEEAAK